MIFLERLVKIAVKTSHNQIVARSLSTSIATSNKTKKTTKRDDYSDIKSKPTPNNKILCEVTPDNTDLSQAISGNTYSLRQTSSNTYSTHTTSDNTYLNQRGSGNTYSNQRTSDNTYSNQRTSDNIHSPQTTSDRTQNTFLTQTISNNTHLPQITSDNTTLPSVTPIDDEIINFNDHRGKKSVLDECDEDISHVAPYLKPTFNFAAYVNKSVTLQELLKLGVDLHKLEKKVMAPGFILRLDFEKDIKNHVIFLHEKGMEIEAIGKLITKNPYIFKEDLEHMQVRLNYLESKKFTGEMITKIISYNPYWLMFSTDRIDTRLGFFQKEFHLTGAEVRDLTVLQPRLITYSMEHIRTNMFCIKEEMGFTDDERKQLLLSKPKLFMKNQKSLLETFEYLHRTMKVPTEILVKQPGVLMCRAFRLKHRHLFLEKLGRLQFNPKKPGYISVLAMASGTDAEFCDTVAKSTVETFNMFLKSL